MILVWKRLGERWLVRSGLDWTVVRPGGLSEDDARAEAEGVVFSAANQQQSNSIPRRLVARVCLDALEMAAANGRIIEITSAVADSDHAIILDQVENGVAVRMAVLYLLASNK